MTESTKKELLLLAAHVESGEYVTPMEVRVALGIGEPSDIVRDALKGSLDAAKAVHEAVLPEFEWKLCTRTGRATVRPKDRHFSWSDGYSANFANAWVAAILRAKAGELS